MCAAEYPGVAKTGQGVRRGRSRSRSRCRGISRRRRRLRRRVISSPRRNDGRIAGANNSNCDSYRQADRYSDTKADTGTSSSSRAASCTTLLARSRTIGPDVLGLAKRQSRRQHQHKCQHPRCCQFSDPHCRPSLVSNAIYGSSVEVAVLVLVDDPTSSLFATTAIATAIAAATATPAAMVPAVKPPKAPAVPFSCPAAAPDPDLRSCWDCAYANPGGSATKIANPPTIKILRTSIKPTSYPEHPIQNTTHNLTASTSGDQEQQASTPAFLNAIPVLAICSPTSLGRGIAAIKFHPKAPLPLPCRDTTTIVSKPVNRGIIERPPPVYNLIPVRVKG